MSRPAKAAIADDPNLVQIARAVLTAARPNRIVLFGSRARGDAHAWSDYDIFVEIDDENCSGAIHSALLGLAFSVDVVTRRSAEYAVRRRDPGTVDYQIARDGRVVYEHPSAPVTLSQRSLVGEPVPARWPSISEWRQEADKDLLVVEQLLAADRPVWDRVCFHAHEAVEKLLKTAIIATNAAPPNTHALADLLALCPQGLRHDDRIRSACDFLQKLWAATRYPGGRALAAPDATAAADAARTVRRIVVPPAGEPAVQ